mgnify:FL=1
MKNRTKSIITVFLIFSSFIIFAQNRTITGIVTSKGDGLPLPGANILVKGKSIGASTNFEGQYTLGVPNKDVTLVFSY